MELPLMTALHAQTPMRLLRILVLVIVNPPTTECLTPVRPVMETVSRAVEEPAVIVSLANLPVLVKRSPASLRLALALLATSLTVTPLTALCAMPTV